MKRKILRWIIGIFLGWRLLLFAVGALAPSVFPYHPTFSYPEKMASYQYPNWVKHWANFDGIQYIVIAQEGYAGKQFIHAFFPLLPFVLMRPIVLLSHLPTIALPVGLILANVCALTALILWYLLLKVIWTTKIAKLGTLALLLFPSSFFLGALYTESLFLTFVFACLLATKQKRWWLAGLMILLASSTRVIGIFLIPALLLEWYIHDKQNWKAILPILLGSLGLLSYMLYLQQTVHDPLAFFHAQSALGAGRSTSLVLYPQVIVRYIKILLTTRPIDFKYLIYIQEFVAGTLGLVGILAVARKVPYSWTVFALCAFFLPTLTGNFSSMSRYLLSCFPLFVALAFAAEKKPLAAVLVGIVFAILQVINVLLFVQGYWVA